MKIAEGKEDKYIKWVDANKDFYSKAVIDFATRWAEMLENIISRKENEDPKNVIYNKADATSRLADTEGITGFQYGCAVQFLADVWKYGKILNSWHNAKWGYSEDTEGTVNPAVWLVG